MALTTDARNDIAAALTSAGLTAHATVPTTIIPPCVIVAPDEPYIEPDRIGDWLRYTAYLRIGCIAQAVDNRAGLANCETLIDQVLTHLPDGVTVSRVGAPSLDDIGAQGAVYVAEVTITAHLEGNTP